MPWRGPLGGNPLECLPGPDNPWLVCDTAASRADDANLPDFALPDDGSLAVDWNKIAVGIGLMVAGIVVIVAAIVGALAVVATLPATATGAPAGVAVAVVGAFLAAAGAILMGAGGATIIGGIDPKISDYKKHVPAVPTRKLSLPADLPRPVVTFMQSVAEVERLSTAETDIIDHARAAAKASDKSWTELHLRDLYHVQNAKQHFVSELGAALKDINAAFGKDFDTHRVDPQEPVRDLINPMIEMRGTLDEAASISSAEINAILGTVRVPSPMSQALDASVRKIAEEAEGQPSAMVNIAVEQLADLDVIDHEAFGVKE